MVTPTSPGVYSQEVDLTTGVPAVSITTGGMVGTFAWGPCLELTEVNTGVQLNKLFGDPDSNTANSFFTAWNFLQYSTDLKVARSVGTNTKNATANSNGQLIMNGTDYFNNVYPTTSTNSWTARYPGALGNSIKVYVWANNAVWTANASNAADPLYVFANQFNYAPNTSPYVTQVTNGGITNDAMHVLVVDALGLVTGTANAILEVWPSLSRLVNSLTPNGVSNYYKEFIWQNSSWVYNTGVPAANTFGWGMTIGAANGNNFQTNSDPSVNVATFGGGSDGVITDANTVTAQTLFSDPVKADIGLFMLADGDTTVTDNMMGIISSLQSQGQAYFVAFGSPPLANTLSPTGPAAAILNYANGLSRSSYFVLDTGWKYQYDQFNNVYRYVPLNGDVAGLCARTDNTNDPWWSPAGPRRGQIQNCIKLAYNPGLTDRNALYQSAINPVVTLKNQGTLLYGDKTFLNYPSVFDEIGVRRLFIFLEKTISLAAQADLFEFNDSITQAAFVNLVTPVLRQVQGRRGIISFKVVCDGTNNTSDVINAQQFVGDIYVIPNMSINYILLHFVAVDNGVSFSTVVGQPGT